MFSRSILIRSPHCYRPFNCVNHLFSSPHSTGECLIDVSKYEKLSEETLESLCLQFEEIIESLDKLIDSDVELSNGVLTVKLANNGTYVINKQTPNRQIWLSSPFTGPKRYDWTGNSWTYKRDQISLQQLLSQEISQYIGTPVKFDLENLVKFV